MGVSLPVSVRRTKLIVIGTTIFSTILFGIISVGVYVYRKHIIAVFSEDDDVKVLAESIWTKVALFNINISIFAVLAGITTGLGQQWTLGIINFVFLWVIGLPIIYYKAVLLNGNLNDVWFWMNFPYLGMNITLGILFIYSDWYTIQKKIIDNNKANKINDNDNDYDDGDVKNNNKLDVSASASVVLTEDKIVDEKTKLLLSQKKI